MFLSFLKKLFGGPDLGPFFDRGAIILDVRTAGEFNSGHVKGAVHVPLDRLSQELGKLKKAGKPYITCCASGRRSGMAADILNRAGIEAVNGGPWSSVDRAVKTRG